MGSNPYFRHEPKNDKMITKEGLIEKGWKLCGNAWYNGPRKITIHEGRVVLWFNGQSKEITKMEEI